MKPQPTSFLILFLILTLAGCAPTSAATLPPTSAPPPTATALPPEPTVEPPAAPLPTDPPHPVPTISSDPALEVVQKMMERFNAGDLEGVRQYWADDARVYFFGLPPTGAEVYLGWEAIRPVWEENIANHLAWELQDPQVNGDIVTGKVRTWHDFTRSIGVAPLEATEVWLVQDGKIKSDAWTVDEASLERIKKVLAEAPAEEAPPTEPQAAVSELAVVSSGGTCSYDGSLALKKGIIDVNWSVEDTDRQLYALTFFTLADGKDFLDLMASTLHGGPSNWANMISYRELKGGESATINFLADESPVYAVCWSKEPSQPVGAFGPFDIIP